MSQRNRAALLVFILTTSFYIVTLSPSLAWGDGVKLQSEVISGESFLLTEMNQSEFTPDPFPYSKVGVTAWDHPLYTIGGNILIRSFPSIDSLWLVNMISALFGAASTVMVFLLAFRYTASIPASAYAAFSLAVSHTFWWHSSTPEVYSLLVFLLLTSIYFLQRHEDSPKTSTLSLSAFFFGLAASNHLLAFLALPALVLYFWFSNRFENFHIRELKKLGISFLAFIAGFSIYLLQLIRMVRGFPLSEIMGPVIGTTFLGNLGALSPGLLIGSLVKFFGFFMFQFGPLGIFLGGIGLRQGSKNIAVQKIISFFVIYTLFGIFYRVSDQFAFFLTSYVFFALFISIGTSHLLATLTLKPRFTLHVCLILTIILTPFLYHYVPHLAQANGIGDAILGVPQVGTGVRNGLAYYIDPCKRGDTFAYEFGSQTISSLPPNSIVIAEWYTDTDEYFVLRYFYKVEGDRPDITIEGFPTQAPVSFDPQLVLDIIKGSIASRPIYLASLSDKFYSAATLVEAYCIVPQHNLYRVHQKSDRASSCLGPDSVTP